LVRVIGRKKYLGFGFNRILLKVIGSVFLLSFLWNSPGNCQETIKIGVLIDGDYWSHQKLMNSVHKELKKLVNGEFTISYPKDAVLNGEYDSEKIKNYAQRLANREDLNLILSLGTEAGLVLAQIDPLPIPVVGMDLFFPISRDLIHKETYHPKNPNWTTSFDPDLVIKVGELLRKLAPIKKVTLLCSHLLCKPEMNVTELIKRTGEEANLDSEVVIISIEDFEEKIAQLDRSLVFIPPLNGFNDSQMIQVYEALAKRKIPAYTDEGIYGIKLGALVSLHENNFVKEGRNYALKIFNILDGISPRDISVKDFQTTKLTFNLETARKINYGIPLEFIDEARLYGKGEVKGRLSFEEAIQTALDQNYDIKVQALIQNQAMKQMEIVRSDYFPQVFSNLNYSRIDDTRADVAPQPRGETTFQLELKQQLVNRELYKSIESAKYGSDVEKKNLEVTNQDIIQEVSLAYIDVLQGEELVQIRRDFLNIIRKNRDIARLKFDLRETDKSDVLRLEIDLENARIELINVQETLFRALVRLNNLLNLPRETEYEFQFEPFSEDSYNNRKTQFADFFRSGEEFKIIRDYFTEDTLNRSAELQSIEASIQQTEADKEVVRSRFLPTAEFNASWFQQLQEDSRSKTAAERGAFDDSFDNGWLAELRLNIPIFLGGSRFKELGQANSKILEFRSRKNNLENDLSERARVALYNVYKNRRNADFSIRNVISAKENLTLLEVAYREGDLPIIDLLDSQTNLIESQITGIRARYQFYGSLFALFRVQGRTEFITGFLDPVITELLKEEMNQYLKQKMGQKNSLEEPLPAVEIEDKGKTNP
jgi:outer membrane protein